jgi:hypothetical protein
MQYMLLIYNEPSSWKSMSEADRGAMYTAYSTFSEELQASGKMVSGDALQDISTATTVRVRDGQTLTTDGPFAETKEVLGGYYLVDVDTLDEALEWAAKLPGSWYGTVEVRPLVTDYETMSA